MGTVISYAASLKVLILHKIIFRNSLNQITEEVENEEGEEERESEISSVAASDISSVVTITHTKDENLPYMDDSDTVSDR